MGIVYKAKDRRLKRPVAIKVLPPEVASDHDRLSRFEQEARAVAALNHSNILAVHDIGLDQGVSFIVTELLEGVDTNRCSLSLGDQCPVMGRCGIQRTLHRLEESYLQSLAKVTVDDLARQIVATPLKETIKVASSRKKPA